MSGCCIGDKEAEMLVKHFPDIKIASDPLEIVGIADNSITVDGLVHIMKILDSSKLQSL